MRNVTTASIREPDVTFCTYAMHNVTSLASERPIVTFCRPVAPSVPLSAPLPWTYEPRAPPSTGLVRDRPADRARRGGRVRLDKRALGRRGRDLRWGRASDRPPARPGLERMVPVRDRGLRDRVSATR